MLMQKLCKVRSIFAVVYVTKTFPIKIYNYYNIFLHTYCFVPGSSKGHPIFSHCVKQLVFGFISIHDDNDVRHHMTDASKPFPNYFQGTLKELYSFLVENFSFPGSFILDMTDWVSLIFGMEYGLECGME